MARVVVGMSGGVDSSATAAMLTEQGHEVIGVTLHLWDYQREGHAGRCCAPEDQYDAKRVCDQLGVAHYTFDRRALFREHVVDPFVKDYGEGRTPSPCVRCNEHVKLGPLWQLAQRLGAEHVASGHYARVRREGDEVVLERAIDLDRDQSYFLWIAPREALDRLLLPLGTMRKPDVRAYMEARGIVSAQKPDSTDLCFVEGQDYTEWVESHGVARRAGTVETLDGTVVATHDGIHRFTVGQRRGITGWDGKARYVLRVIADRGAVVVGTNEEAETRHVRVNELRWLTSARPERAEVKLRYKHKGVGCTIVAKGETAELLLDEPQRGAAPGQAAVFYVGERVVGGGFIV
ncbi:MAG: tRNA 2-thiouridine(34) synthase MnmA [Myxococcales bacterium]|nr:tRNA 2-thiouridine(34) synthase MnmA [Myxococcales bacterium]